MQRHPLKLIVLVLTLGVLLLSACGALAGMTSSQGESEMPQTDMVVSEEAMEPGLAEAPSFDDGAREEAFAADAFEGAAAERLVIRNAHMSIVVAEPGDTQSQIAAMAEEMGGFVVESNLFQTTTATGLEVPSAYITVRVPAERLQEALGRIEDFAIRVESRNVSGQDVTAEYTDLQSRLRNLEDAEDLLREIMQEAEDTEDVLVAFEQLNRITEQIEVLRGQIQYYEEAAALSAITVNLIASAAEQPITIGGWEPEGVAREAIQALVEALQGLANAIIWFLLYVLPVLLVIGLPLWLLVRGVRRWRAQRSK